MSDRKSWVLTDYSATDYATDYEKRRKEMQAPWHFNALVETIALAMRDSRLMGEYELAILRAESAKWKERDERDQEALRKALLELELAAPRTENERLLDAISGTIQQVEDQRRRAERGYDEAKRLREAALDVVTVHADVVGDNPAGAIGRLHAVLSSTPATRREVERVRVMERVVEALKVLSGRLPPRDIVEQLADEKGLRPVPMVYTTTNEVRQVYDALAAYEQVVKE